MAAKEFEELALNGHNYPTWAMDVKISLASRGIARAIQDPKTPLPAGATPLIADYDYGISYTPSKTNIMADALSHKSYCNNHMAFKAQPLHDDLTCRELPIRVLIQAERLNRLRAVKFQKISGQILLNMKPLGNSRIIFEMNAPFCFRLPPKITGRDFLYWRRIVTLG